MRTGTSLLAASAAVAVIGTVALTHSALAGSGAAPPRQLSAHTISVSGHGEVMLAPDEATLSVGVQTTGSDSQAAMSANADRMQAVVSAIEAHGVPAKSIQTGQLSLWYDQEKDRYVATHMLTVRLDDVTQAGAILDAAVSAGANMTWGVGFGLKDPAAGQAQALKGAVANARAHADAIAAALGVTVSGVQSVSTVTYSNPAPLPAAAASAPSAGATTPVQPGQLTVTADLTVVYSFS